MILMLITTAITTRRRSTATAVAIIFVIVKIAAALAWEMDIIMEGIVICVGIIITTILSICISLIINHCTHTLSINCQVSTIIRVSSSTLQGYLPKYCPQHPAAVVQVPVQAQVPAHSGRCKTNIGINSSRIIGLPRTNKIWNGVV